MALWWWRRPFPNTGHSRLEGNLKLAQEHERIVAAERDARHIELRALHEDTAFLEIQARDRLDYFREGERVLRFKRDR